MSANRRGVASLWFIGCELFLLYSRMAVLSQTERCCPTLLFTVLKFGLQKFHRQQVVYALIEQLPHLFSLLHPPPIQFQRDRIHPASVRQLQELLVQSVYKKVIG
ncbi:hypothetical protein [Chlorogloeopsis sp. ULAP02]|uniref:hypothetical protein n=1 Tax=Chlorogloeopsis sp. ULAP02 TaxID=3107926 RepID=UPI0031351D3E